MIPPEPWRGRPFQGAKGAILVGGRLLAMLRDDLPSIPWPGRWDLPGGGREGAESPRETLAREAGEELGLALGAASWLWGRAFAAGGAHAPDGGPEGWLFVLRLAPEAARGLRLGEEGQAWALLRPEDFLASTRGVPFLQGRLALALAEIGGAGASGALRASGFPDFQSPAVAVGCNPDVT